MKAIVDEAHRRGHKVAAHAFSDAEIRQGLIAGIQLTSSACPNRSPTTWAGTDVGSWGEVTGHATWMEADLWVRELGMDPMTVIRKMTLDAAGVMGAAGESGSLSEGKFADLIAVRGDPLAPYGRSARGQDRREAWSSLQIDGAEIEDAELLPIARPNADDKRRPMRRGWSGTKGASIMNRRSFIRLSGGAISTGIAFRRGLPSALAQGAARPTTGSTVETTAGKIRGYVEQGVHVFKGVPYGAAPLHTAAVP